MRCDPVGTHEIAQRLGEALGKPVPRATVAGWHYRRQEWERTGSPARRARDEPMPAPRWTVSNAPAWAWHDVEAWAQRTGRLPVGE